MPFLVEMMLPEQAVVQIGLMFAFTVKTLKGVEAWFTLFCL